MSELTPASALLIAAASEAREAAAQYDNLADKARRIAEAQRISEGFRAFLLASARANLERAAAERRVASMYRDEHERLGERAP
jgi:prophage DNA circulation protein